MSSPPNRNPLFTAFALVGLMFGPARDATEDMPESRTHSYFPDHVWPYAILAMATLITLGLLALVGQPLLQLGQAADPRASAVPRPEWYFLSQFQFVKLGPALITSIVVPLALVLGLLSLAGIPPTPGFWAKLAVLHAAWTGLGAFGFWATLIAALGGVFGALYYMKPLPALLSVVREAGASRLPSSSTPAVPTCSPGSSACRAPRPW